MFSLCFFREGAALSRVNYRDMDSEELGSVYESLLELVPVVTLGGGARIFGFVGDDEEGSTKGNQCPENCDDNGKPRRNAVDVFLRRCEL